MLSAIWKETYRNHGIYWHGRQGYGDETIPMFRTMAEMRQAIDARIAVEAAKPLSPHEAYWGGLTASQQRWWRQNMNWDSDLTVAEQAYAAR
jgi:hypothetical protein